MSYRPAWRTRTQDPMSFQLVRNQSQKSFRLVRNLPVYLTAIIILLVLSACSFSDNTHAGTDTETGGTVTGIIEAEDQGASVEVLLKPVNFNPATMDFTEVPKTSSLDETGGFRFAGVEPGTYNLISLNTSRNLGVLVRGVVVEEFKTTEVQGSPLSLAPMATIRIYFRDFNLNKSGLLYIPGVSSAVAVTQNEYAEINVPAGTYNEIKFADLDTDEITPLLDYEIDLAPGEVEITSPYSGWQAHYNINIATGSLGLQNNVTDFPLLVRLGSTFDFSMARPSGEDLRFTSSAGIPLEYEIEQWDADAGSAVIWVKADTLYSELANTNIKLYSGNFSAEAVASPSAVFDTANGFGGVWHLGDDVLADSMSILDATTNGAHGTGYNFGDTASIPAIIGSGRQFSGDSSWIAISNEPVFDMHGQITLSAWFYVNEFNVIYQSLITKGDNAFRLARDETGDSLTFAVNKSPAGAMDGSVKVNDSSWHHVTATFDGTSARLYLDGVLDNSTDLIVELNNNAYPVWLGANAENAGRYWNGKMDEVRISKTARSADWIKLSYENQKTGSTLVDLSEKRIVNSEK